MTGLRFSFSNATEKCVSVLHVFPEVQSAWPFVRFIPRARKSLGMQAPGIWM